MRILSRDRHTHFHFLRPNTRSLPTTRPILFCYPQLQISGQYFSLRWHFRVDPLRHKFNPFLKFPKISQIMAILLHGHDSTTIWRRPIFFATDFLSDKWQRHIVPAAPSWRATIGLCQSNSYPFLSRLCIFYPSQSIPKFSQPTIQPACMEDSAAA